VANGALTTHSNATTVERAMYTLPEFAVLLGIGYTGTHQMAQTDTLPIRPIRIGRKYLFPKAAVHRLLGAESEASRGSA
jgi:excisionase family DNA binding protein